MVLEQSYSSPPPYTASAPGLHYPDYVPNHPHSWAQWSADDAMSYQRVYRPQPQPEHLSSSTYQVSGDTYRQHRVQNPNIQYSPHSPYQDQDQVPFRQQQQVAQCLRPCVIPQITKVFGGANMSPFARARARDLEAQTGLTQRDLLHFIDGLNEAFLANPALQATDKIGMLVGFVPSAAAQIVGGGLQVAAGLGSAGVSVVRTKQYLRKANEVIFNPRGLSVRVVKTEKMLSLIGVQDSRIFSGEQYRALVGDGTEGHSPLDNRMAALGDRVMPLSFNGLAASADEDNWMKKWGVYSAHKTEKKQLEKLEKEERRSKKSEKKGKSDKKSQRKERKIEDNIADLNDEMDDIKQQMQYSDPRHPDQAKKGRELQRRLRSLERKLDDLEEERQYDMSRKSDRGERSQAKKDEKAEKKINKLQWIVILPVDVSTGDEEHDLKSDSQ